MPPAAGDFVMLPATFTPTHQTDGLPGFPAVDVFGRPGALVVADFYGRVDRISGRPCSLGGSPHGPYGRSVYVRNGVNNQTRYITHLDCLAVSVGDRVKPGSIIGTICDSAKSGLPGTSHAHLGHKR